jgi:hypothetical protein
LSHDLQIDVTAGPSRFLQCSIGAPSLAGGFAGAQPPSVGTQAETAASLSVCVGLHVSSEAHPVPCEHTVAQNV